MSVLYVLFVSNFVDVMLTYKTSSSATARDVDASNSRCSVCK